MRERCSIHFNVFHEAPVGVHITDLNGRVLVTLMDERLVQGRYTTQWNGNDASGSSVAAGMYLCVLHMDGKPIKAQRIVKE